jgi:hypothetical protein
MGYTVVHEGEAAAKAYWYYDFMLHRLLLKLGVPLDRVPRTRDLDHADHWLYVWEKEEDARAFAEEMKTELEDPQWHVREVKGPLSVGPLRPILITAGQQRDGITFGLNTFTEHMLQTRFPGSCQNESVSVTIPYDWWGKADWQTSQEGLRKLARQVLPILTGLGDEQLQGFGGFQVVDPVRHLVLVPTTSIPPQGEAEGRAVGGSEAEAGAA